MSQLLNRRDALALTAAAVAAPTLTATAAASAQAASVRNGLAGPWTGGGDVPTLGGKLHYVTLGPKDGEPLVLLPKLGGWIADWRHAAPALAAKRRVIVFDLPGHGASRMEGAPPHIVTVPEVSAAILNALDQMGIDRCAMAGNSLGGIVGIVSAACWPARVSKLVLVSTSLAAMETRESMAKFDARPTDAPGALGSYSADGRPLPPTAEQNKMFGTIDPRVIEEQTASREAAGLWLRAQERGAGRAGVADYLPRVQVPTLILNADRGHYVKYAAVGLKLIPNARAVTIEQSGAFIHQEKPAQTAAAMNAFLDERA